MTHQTSEKKFVVVHNHLKNARFVFLRNARFIKIYAFNFYKTAPSQASPSVQALARPIDNTTWYVLPVHTQYL
jgi:hypothetical protein